MMPLVYRFPDHHQAELSEVGGKGLSLMRMAGAGLPVPAGFVLLADFFSPWIEQLRSTAQWQDFLESSEQQLPARCQALKERSGDLSLTLQQQQALSEASRGWPPSALFAVRSSSPEEDLEGASFAGGYKTILGVTPVNLLAAIRSAFASCLDYRVLVYKQRHGFDIRRPQIAVVVQSQIASDIAGVGFSINPVTNDYDEAIFNSNWGLGESVVGGLATPDTFMVDKFGGYIKQRLVGAKETSIWLSRDGGTQERRDPRHSELTLSDEQILSLLAVLVRVENLYGKPIDIEWAFSQEQLYLLQARPITTYIPLSDEMMTAPGQPKRLYLDLTISAQGLYKPLSVMTTSIFRVLLKQVSRKLFGVDLSSKIDTTLPWAQHGRLYLNLSKAFAIGGKDKIASAIAHVDPLAAESIRQVDEEPYRSHGFKLRTLPWSLWWKLPAKALHVPRAVLFPVEAHRRCQRRLAQHVESARQLGRQQTSLDEFTHELLARTIHLLLTQVVPSLLAAGIAIGKIRALLGPSCSRQMQQLFSSLPNNVTVEMGLALYEVAQLLPEGLAVEQLEGGIRSRALPQTFLDAWTRFLDLYGHRGPLELDVAAARYREKPRMLLEQLINLRAASDRDENPKQRYERMQRERQQAFSRVFEKIKTRGWLQAKKFRLFYRVVETLGGYRETPKFYAIFALDLLRTRILKEADGLIAAGRLERREQVFDLTLQDLEQALRDPALDLRERASGNRVFSERLARVPQLPRVIDSRGRIFHPAARAPRQGEVVGTGVSAGTARGPVKVLHAPDEKPLRPGDVLVARATDPGWTPLFISAAAVLLEVGGLLQHGALVAREYGLPCVAGIANVTDLWKDGTVVEVDGTAGTVRVVGP